jgi:predicted RNA-binding protein YlxR (DUF448 family)
MKTKKVPLRICVGCQEPKNKKEMIRIVLTPEGNVEIDKTGKKSGRGAYICPQAECLEKAYKEHRLERSLKTKVSNEIYEALKQDLL